MRLTRLLIIVSLSIQAITRLLAVTNEWIAAFGHLPAWMTNRCWPVAQNLYICGDRSSTLAKSRFVTASLRQNEMCTLSRGRCGVIWSRYPRVKVVTSNTSTTTAVWGHFCRRNTNYQCRRTLRKIDLTMWKVRSLKLLDILLGRSHFQRGRRYCAVITVSAARTSGFVLQRDGQHDLTFSE